MKRIYQKPEMKVVLLQHKTCLLIGSPGHSTPPEEIPDYDGWLGARKFNGAWDDEDDWDEEEF
jgi:hypothetical protein